MVPVSTRRYPRAPCPMSSSSATLPRCVTRCARPSPTPMPPIRELESGKQLLPAVQEGVPDLAVIDLQIGNMGGMAACLDLRLEEGAGRLPHVPVLMLLDRRPDVFLARRSQADGWLVKPSTLCGCARRCWHCSPGTRTTTTPTCLRPSLSPRRRPERRRRAGPVRIRSTPHTGSGAAWLARSVRDAEAAGSNPAFPTLKLGGQRPGFRVTRRIERLSSRVHPASTSRGVAGSGSVLKQVARDSPVQASGDLPGDTGGCRPCVEDIRRDHCAGRIRSSHDDDTAQ